jgi:hypothetical protein
MVPTRRWIGGGAGSWVPDHGSLLDAVCLLAKRNGYKTFSSGIRCNTDCPNLLIRRDLNDAIQHANNSSQGKIHLIGHSLGGSWARAGANA